MPIGTDVADVHVTHDHDNAMAKFEKAVSYFNDVEKVAFTCIAGDLISTGTSAASYSRNGAAGMSGK